MKEKNKLIACRSAMPSRPPPSGRTHAPAVKDDDDDIEDDEEEKDDEKEGKEEEESKSRFNHQ